jgi:hypothetical protein
VRQFKGRFLDNEADESCEENRFWSVGFEHRDVIPGMLGGFRLEHRDVRDPVEFSGPNRDGGAASIGR